jgi:hypothetical protein
MQKMCVDCSSNPGGHPIFHTDDTYAEHRASAHGEPYPAKPEKPPKPEKPADEAPPAPADVERLTEDFDEMCNSLGDRIARIERARAEDAATLEKIATQSGGLADTVGSLISRAPYATAREVDAMQKTIVDLAGRLTVLEGK